MATAARTDPHSKNACAGAFQDWLEVNLLPECNGRCSWCVERRGYHPNRRAHWQEMADAILDTGLKNVILLGGEPLLYKDLGRLLIYISGHGLSVRLTTNGALLHRRLKEGALIGLTGVNISIHDYYFAGNLDITGLLLDEFELSEDITQLRNAGVKVRFNCNLILGHVDSLERVHRYIQWAKDLGATHVRFAELKLDDGNFVDAFDLFRGLHGTNDEPFTMGCNKDTLIDGMEVNIRQMCGLQTPHRPCPHNPQQYTNQVLYYDGHLYAGWQCPGGLDSRALRGLLRQVAQKQTTVDEAAVLLGVGG